MKQDRYTNKRCFYKPHIRKRHNRREDDKHESPHCDTDTVVPWKTSQQHYGCLQLYGMHAIRKVQRNRESDILSNKSLTLVLMF